VHPAYSVILFTTASGAGYGLLIWLAIAALLGDAPASLAHGVIAFGLAFVLIIGGLLSSTMHLGRPERAWRALSQWSTSWLSREGILAVVTFVPAGLFALATLYRLADRTAGPFALTPLLALATILSALATVWCTGMIYQSLPTIRAWHRPLVSPIYVALALMSGAVLFHALAMSMSVASDALGLIAIGLLLAGGLLKLEYWRGIDTDKKTWTAESATGLGRFGKVRVLEQPHSQANYIMREMGYAVARRHATRLRRLTLLTAFALPAGLIALASVVATSWLAVVFSVAAVLIMAFGLITERWLFFAEAQHVVTTFYGADAA
jgi:sulfite dehydrogenase (quinone) subunit SoeC